MPDWASAPGTFVLECNAARLATVRHNRNSISEFAVNLPAHVLFFAQYHLREFEEAWQLAVPDDMKTSVKHLEV